MLRLAASALLLLSCRPNDLEWEIRIEPPELRDRVVRLDARIVEGACPGTTVEWSETIYPSSGASDLPELDEGTWCFAAQAGDTSCNWIGAGSATASLPSDEPIVVTVTETAPSPSCPGVCTDGRCDDSGAICGGALICNESCAAVCDYTCSDTASCSYDCRGDACDVTCSAGSTCDVDCRGGTCDLRCTGDADCTFQCDGGVCTFACDGTGTCTTSCTGGVCEGP